MKRRILMVSAMILLLASQVQMSAQKRHRPDHRRPGIEIRDHRRPERPMYRRPISQREIIRLQDFYWRKYRIRLSRGEAERILIAQMRGNCRYQSQPWG
jgi:hypothetical protein